MRLDEIPYMDPRRDIEQTETLLPHWHQDGRTYFVTFRLADSLPQAELEKLEDEKVIWLGNHPEPWTIEVEQQFHARFSAKIEKWLDAGYGACELRDPRHAAVVGNSLAFFEGDRCTQLTWVVMPNHVHALFVLHRPHKLKTLIGSWKRHAAHQINSGLGRNGAFWRRDYFDRLIRDSDHLCNCIRYIRRNPVKAGLKEGEFLLWQSDLAKGIE